MPRRRRDPAQPQRRETHLTPVSGRPSVLVGIATYNRAAELPKAIRSAFAQSYRPLRVAVIDDASTDNTPDLHREFPAVSWERCEPGQGYVRARNYMMLNADEDYFVSLDDDSWFIQGDEIALAVDFLERSPRTAAIAFDIISRDQPAQASRGDRNAVALFVGCGHMLRLSVVREFGGYSEFPGTYGVEEKDLCLRLIDAGYSIVQLDGVHVWHEKSIVARDIVRQHRSGVCNDFTFAVRRLPTVLLLPTIVWKLFWHLVFAVRHGLLWAYLQGVRDFAVAWADVWRSRRPVSRASITEFRELSKAPRRLAG